MVLSTEPSLNQSNRAAIVDNRHNSVSNQIVIERLSDLFTISTRLEKQIEISTIIA